MENIETTEKELVKVIAPKVKALAQKAKVVAAKTPAKPVVSKAKAVVKKDVKVVAKLAQKIEKAAQEEINETVAEVKETAKKSKNKLVQAYQTTKATNKILIEAGGKIIQNSINTTKSIAGVYRKAGKKAMDLSKNVLEETFKLATENQKNTVTTSVKAFKDTVETIRESNIIELPKKNSKKK